MGNFVWSSSQESKLQLSSVLVEGYQFYKLTMAIHSVCIGNEGDGLLS